MSHSWWLFRSFHTDDLNTKTGTQLTYQRKYGFDRCTWHPVSMTKVHVKQYNQSCREI